MSNKNNDRELTAGEMLGRYELLMPIAKGGMGTVWAARLKGSRGFRKLCAIKTILHTLEHPAQEQMLYQEAVLASQIHHPNVAETLELGEQDGMLYLVMELVSGESLRFVLREAQALGGMPMAVAINLIGQVCRGLAAAHDLRDNHGERVGLVHRDISPPNIMITEAGTVKIVDFGVATTSSSIDTAGEIKGKISYLAPEQLRGEPVDARADVFATGILLYLLTVGMHPFRTASEPSTIARILSKAPATTPSALMEDYPDALEQIVMCALHKDRRERFQSISAMLDALENAFPNAFGPRADEAAASYLTRLMKERIFERKETLRNAEELAERSSSRHSELSLPAITTSSAPLARPKGSALIGLGGLFAGLGAAALAGTLYLQGFRSTAHSAAALVLRELPAAAMNPSSASATQGSLAPQAPSEAELCSSSSGQTMPSNSLRPRRALSDRATKRQQADRDERVSEPATAIAPEVSAQPPTPSPISAPPTPEARTEAQAEPSDLHSNVDQRATGHALQVAAPATAVTPPAPVPVVSTTPRLLSSRLGQNQLLSNPASATSRVRLPLGLDRMGQSFNAIVRICVTTEGSVSSANILKSAGPVLDQQIPNALSHWRYRPLLEGGRPTPFCYVLNYEISAR